MQPVRRGYLDGPDGQIHYRYSVPSTHPAAPFLVMLHQTPSSSVIYERVLGHLGEHIRAFAIDTPGYGNSDPPPRPLTIPEYADRVRAFLDAIGAERATVLGQHTGASIAVDL